MKSHAATAEFLEEIAQLMELQGENMFKVRAFQKAASLIGHLPDDEDLRSRAELGTLTELDGIGKGIALVLTQFLVQGDTSARDSLKTSLPPGLLELTSLPGLGPKKARVVIDELGVSSISELEYACRENRLLKIKGFGEKAQHKILEAIAFRKTTQGQQRLADIFESAEAILKVLLRVTQSGRHPAATAWRVSETGALRRRMEVLSELEYLIEIPPGQSAAEDIRARCLAALSEFKSAQAVPLPVNLYFSVTESFGYELARTTASPEHWRALGAPVSESAVSEEIFYQARQLPIVPPETRETGEEIALARSGELAKLLPWNGVQGIFHNHTTRSDGTASLEEMVIEAKRLGYKYFGVSDHSQTAFYAQGLKPDALKEQEREIRDVQERHPEIRIFWGVESDILADGSLDYEPSVLKKFDFVIASVHSRFQMDRQAMTDRILAAVRNPFTRFLGHATGRLLLGRKGYDVDLEKIIEAAAQNDVAIEINANPARLDIDWRWGPSLRRFNTKVSVNPDAHELAGLSDTRYGVAVARKALLPVNLVVNSQSAEVVAKWLERA